MNHPYRTPGECVTELIEQVIAQQLPAPKTSIPRPPYVSTIEKILAVGFQPRFERGVELRAAEVLDFVGGVYLEAVAVPDTDTPKRILCRTLSESGLRRGPEWIVDRVAEFCRRVEWHLTYDPTLSPWLYRRAHGWPA